MSKHTTLGQLSMLAQRFKTEIDKVDERVTDLSDTVSYLVSTGGEPNKIEGIKNNGAALEITEDKTVDIGAAIAAAVASSNHLVRKVVTAVSDIDLAAADADKFIYMVPNDGADDSNQYDEYMVLSGKIEHVGNTKVDMDGKVDKEDGKGLSSNDYTSEEKTKLGTVAEGATKVEAGSADGTVKINGTDVTVIEIATDEEVTAALAEVFGA